MARASDTLVGAVHRVVVDSPPFSQHAQLLHRVEYLSIQKLIPQFRVEAFANRYPSGYVRELPLSPSHPPVPRLPWHCSNAAWDESAITPVSIHRAGSAFVPFCRHTSWHSRSHNSRHGWDVSLKPHARSVVEPQPVSGTFLGTTVTAADHNCGESPRDEPKRA